jgi:hypothetical protein
MSESEDPLVAIARQMRERHEGYAENVLNSRQFQDGLRYLEGIASDFLTALTESVRPSVYL